MSTDTCWSHLLLVLSILCAVCSVLCKELGFTVLGVCLLYDFILHKVKPDHTLIQLLFHKKIFQSVFSLFLLRKASRAPHIGGVLRRCAILLTCAAAMLLMRISVMKSMPKFSK